MWKRMATENESLIRLYMKKSIFALVAILSAITGGALVWNWYSTSAGSVPCSSVLLGSIGEYRSLARVDRDGYIYPIGNMMIDDTAQWSITVYVNGRKAMSSDLSDLRRFQNMKFVCTGRDSGTAGDSISIFRTGKLMYSTGVYNDGLQNAEIGLARAYNPVQFFYFLVRI